MMLRAEFPVHRNRTLYSRSAMSEPPVSLGRATARTRGRHDGLTARLRGPRLSGLGPWHDVIAEHRAFTEGVKSLPRDPFGVGNPSLVALRIAASSVKLFSDHLTSRFESRTDSRKVLAGFHLETQVINLSLRRSRGDREIDAWVLEYPLGVVRFND